LKEAARRESDLTVAGRLIKTTGGVMRIEEMSQGSGGLLVKVANWFSRRRFGKIVDPVKVMARHLWVLLGSWAFEMAFER